MDTDLILALGLVVLALSLPAFLTGWSESRLSRTGVVLLAMGVGLLGWAFYAAPQTYRLVDIPHVLLGVVARVIN